MNPLVTPVETIEADETASRALRKLEDHQMLVVTRNGKYAGELHPALLLRFKGDADVMKVAKLYRKGSVLSEKDAKLPLIIDRFSKGGMKWITILDKYEKPIGIVEAGSVLQHAGEALRGKHAADYVEKILSVESSTTVDKAEEVMVKQGVLELSVMENKKFIGLITARDIAVKVKPFLHKKLHDVKQGNKIDVEKEMVRSLITPEFEVRKVSGSDSVYEALREVQFKEPFVFEGTQLKGKLSFPRILQDVEVEEPAHIEVSGLSKEEEMFKESIFEECARMLRKLGRNGNLHLRIKSAQKGKDKKIYEVHGRLEINGNAFVCSTPEIRQHRENWDLGMSVAEVLDELKESYFKSK